MIVVEFAMETVRHALLLRWPSQKTGKRRVNKSLNFNGFNLESKKGSLSYPNVDKTSNCQQSTVSYLFSIKRWESCLDLYSLSCLRVLETMREVILQNMMERSVLPIPLICRQKTHTGQCSKKDKAALVWFCCSCFNCPRSVWIITDETAFRVVIYALKRFSF